MDFASGLTRRSMCSARAQVEPRQVVGLMSAHVSKLEFSPQLCSERGGAYPSEPAGRAGEIRPSGIRNPIDFSFMMPPGAALA